MSPIVTTRNVTKRYGDVAALDSVSLCLEENVIHGLLGRNGAGKTTLIQVLTGQNFATSGQVEVFGLHPYENPAVLDRICLIKDSQRYPDPFKVRHVLAAARMLLPNWDQELAESLLRDFDLPTNRIVKTLSRGMHSAVGVIVGWRPAPR